ncbi:SMP-30/gluconolactonase/LRE family protein [Aquabacterium sp.]|uniref:SMP-30/gluconolactonase/LRE family protein n=1 Tax=Aquabacterium sp. TaxID=1872578 RepID=UPI003784E28C
MFAPPELLQFRQVARLPEHLHVHGRISGRYGTRKYYLEGPAVARDGTLYFTDVPGGRILRLTPAQEIELFLEYDGEPNGLKIHRDGRLFVADNRHGILCIDPVSKTITPYCERVANERLRGPNDLVFADNGNLYFTDQGNSDITRPHGRVVLVRPDGRAELVLQGIPSPNGIVLSVDQAWLYVAVTRSNAVWRAQVLPDGRVDRCGVYVQLSGGGGPDGMAVDERNNLIVAHSSFGAIWVFDPKGEPLYRANSPTGGLGISNVSFGGPEHRTLYVTESVTGTILALDMPQAGQRLLSHQ